MISKKIRMGLVMAMLFAMFTGRTHAQGVVFMHDLDSALEKAKQENKFVFVDFYTSWCGPCKMMAKEVFPLAEVGVYYNEKFINCSVQCDDKGKGELAGKRYNISAYPTLMFLDKNGNNVHSVAGGLSGKALIELAETAMDPARNQQAMVNEWNAGNRSQVFMERYFRTLVQSYRGDKATADFEAWFATLDAAAKSRKSTYQLMDIVRVAPFTPPFEFLEANRELYGKNLGKPVADSFVASKYLWYLKSVHANGMYNKDMSQFNAAVEKFRAKKYPYCEEYLQFYDVFDSKDSNGKDDIELYMRKGTAFLAKYGRNNDAYAETLASMLGNWTGGKDKGKAGIAWMEELMERNHAPRLRRTYFYILWRNFHWDKALEVGQQMREDNLRAGKNTADIDKQIEMVKELKVKYGA